MMFQPCMIFFHLCIKLVYFSCVEPSFFYLSKFVTENLFWYVCTVVLILLPTSITNHHEEQMNRKETGC